MLITNLEGVNIKGVKFFVHEKRYSKIEKQNNTSICVFCYVYKTPYRIYTSRQTSGKHADLLPISTSKNANFV